MVQYFSKCNINLINNSVLSRAWSEIQISSKIRYKKKTNNNVLKSNFDFFLILKCILFLYRTNLEPPWLQEAVFDNIIYKLDTSRNIAVRHSEKNFTKKLHKSISLAVSFINFVCKV